MNERLCNRSYDEIYKQRNVLKTSIGSKDHVRSGSVSGVRVSESQVTKTLFYISFWYSQ